MAAHCALHRACFQRAEWCMEPVFAVSYFEASTQPPVTTSKTGDMMCLRQAGAHCKHWTTLQVSIANPAAPKHLALAP